MELSPEDRSREGMFLSFQYPVEIPGVSMVNLCVPLLTNTVNITDWSLYRHPIFLSWCAKRELLWDGYQIVQPFGKRRFSGGEKKRNEIFQMAMLDPKLAILDETDSGLDIDALRIVANGVNQLKTPHNAAIVITHYQRLLEYIKPDVGTCSL